ncbi:hypothetical protein [Moorena sp. SIO3H5]|nr:hypothetical protein [Moorena sp. SIO3H5]NEO70996.1 hypothetical protein [Moorena sp. SIO3H5]
MQRGLEGYPHERLHQERKAHLTILLLIVCSRSVTYGQSKTVLNGCTQWL